MARLTEKFLGTSGKQTNRKTESHAATLFLEIGSSSAVLLQTSKKYQSDVFLGEDYMMARRMGR